MPTPSTCAIVGFVGFGHLRDDRLGRRVDGLDRLTATVAELAGDHAPSVGTTFEKLELSSADRSPVFAEIDELYAVIGHAPRHLDRNIASVGLAASANINPERVFPSLFEPVHGSAPDIAGQGKADPALLVLIDQTKQLLPT